MDKNRRRQAKNAGISQKLSKTAGKGVPRETITQNDANSCKNAHRVSSAKPPEPPKAAQSASICPHSSGSRQKSQSTRDYGGAVQLQNAKREAWRGGSACFRPFLCLFIIFSFVRSKKARNGRQRRRFSSFLPLFAPFSHLFILLLLLFRFLSEITAQRARKPVLFLFQGVKRRKAPLH